MITNLIVEMRRWLLAAVFVIVGGAASAAEPNAKPMARFAPFVGTWQVRHTLWPKPGQPPEVFEGTATIYFVADGDVLVVDESTADRRYRFIGYHTYDAPTGKYVNWTASSRMVLACGEGEWEQSRATFRTHRLDPRTGKPDPLVGKGVWELVDGSKHVFKALRVGADGAEIPFKEEIYTRLR